LGPDAPVLVDRALPSCGDLDVVAFVVVAGCVEGGEDTMSAVEVKIDARRLLSGGLVISVILFAVHMTMTLFEPEGAGQIANLKFDTAIPTWFASAMLFVSSVLFLLVWNDSRQTDRHNRFYWLGLAAVFLTLSIDEVAALHEWLGASAPIDDRGGYFTHGWVILGIGAVGVFALLYARFIFQLPTRLRNLLLLSGVVYLGGALAWEMFNGNLQANNASLNRYDRYTGVEELFEFVGAALFICAAAVETARRNVHLQVTFSA
jgi:hypothetical protein